MRETSLEVTGRAGAVGKGLKGEARFAST